MKKGVTRNKSSYNVVLYSQLRRDKTTEVWITMNLNDAANHHMEAGVFCYTNVPSIMLIRIQGKNIGSPTDLRQI